MRKMRSEKEKRGGKRKKRQQMSSRDQWLLNGHNCTREWMADREGGDP